MTIQSLNFELLIITVGVNACFLEIQEGDTMPPLITTSLHITTGKPIEKVIAQCKARPRLPPQKCIIACSHARNRVRADSYLRNHVKVDRAIPKPKLLGGNYP